jgi:hypothetical protein
LSICFCPTFSQNKILSSGNWNSTAIWQGADVADAITENVIFNTGPLITATVPAATSYTIGDIDLQSHRLTVSGVLNIGQAGTPKNLTAVGGAINVPLGGTLTIWGNVNATGGIAFTVGGNLIIKGNVNMGNNGGFTIGNAGHIVIEGNMTAGTNTNGNFANGGTLTVVGDVVAGTSSTSNATPGGPFKARTCSGPAAFCGNAVLPIELFQLKADVVNDAVLVKWTTATEINVDYFTIQRSVDGHTFSDVGTVKAFGSSTVLRSYSLTDPDPLIGNIYYRLHSVDFDGKDEFSYVVVARYLTSKTIDIYPNPSAGGIVNIRLNFNPNEETTNTLVDTFGRTIAQFSMHTSLETFDVHHVGPGVYFVKTKTGNDVWLSRIVFTEAH